MIDEPPSIDRPEGGTQRQSLVIHTPKKAVEVEATNSSSKEILTPVAEKDFKVAPFVNIGSNSSNELAASLTNPTLFAKERGSINKDYPVSFQDNVFVKAGK